MTGELMNEAAQVQSVSQSPSDAEHVHIKVMITAYCL